MENPKPADNPTIQTVSISRYEQPGMCASVDSLAVEEPLEIQILHWREPLWACHSLAVTMRTPGADSELALGFLYTEGALPGPEAVAEVGHKLDDQGEPICNLIQVRLHKGTPFDYRKFSRHVFTSSSCGICGKTTIASLRAARLGPPSASSTLNPKVLVSLPDALVGVQETFRLTGGLHASALFDMGGKLLEVWEDVGRHNALDKLIGSRLRRAALPASDTILLVSGRASFELVQKALVAGIPVLAAVGAPSSLAVDLAREFGLTLVGFLRNGRFNVYTGGKGLAAG